MASTGDANQRLTGQGQGVPNPNPAADAAAPPATGAGGPGAAGPGPGQAQSTSPRRTQHRHIHLTVRTPQMANNNNNNNNGEFPQQTQNLFHMRDRLFLALFFRVSLIYARAFPRTLRRLLEFCLLMQSILLLFILTYIHIAYNQTPITCLSEHKNSWPKDGILRVEITTDPAVDYDVQKSYAKEERLRQKAESEGNNDLLTMMLTADTLLLNKMVTTAEELIQSVTSSKTDSTTTAPETTEAEPEPPDTVVTASESLPDILPLSDSPSDPDDDIEIDADIVTTTSKNLSGFGKEMDPDSPSKMGAHIRKKLPLEPDTISPSFVRDRGPEGDAAGNAEEYDFASDEEEYFNKTVEEIEIIKMNKKKLAEERILKSSVSDLEMFTNSVWLQDQAYIVEYALEYGFLRLSPETRQRLNIPVKIVTLDPSKEACFGDTFSRFLLDNFLGYDDILMSSIKNLAESEDNKGYLRNVVTGEQFRFVPMWMARTAYIPALIIMLVFTVSISMLLRYSHHQIFVFIVDLLNNIEGVGAIHIPAAPLFTVILALVGMEAIMSEFFNDTSTAFYVILIVWIADQYDSVCSHTPITRAYWVRFFYLYHFAFYAYHYRFNGQYGGLALLVSWSFIQHSMVYFYHHYELPTILRQAQQDDDPDVIAAAAAGPGIGHNFPGGGGGANASNANPRSSTSSTQTGPSAPASAAAAAAAGPTSPSSGSTPTSSHPSSNPSGPNPGTSPVNSSSPSHNHNRSSSVGHRCNITFSHHLHNQSPVGTPLAESVRLRDGHAGDGVSRSPNGGGGSGDAQDHHITAAATASASIIINTTSTEPVGLNVNLNDLSSPSTSTGLRLRINLPQRQDGEPSAFVQPQPRTTTTTTTTPTSSSPTITTTTAPVPVPPPRPPSATATDELD